MENTVILSIDTLPGSPFNGTGTVGIVITNGVPSYFKIVGVNLHQITSVTWYPATIGSVLFQTRNIILVDDTNTLGTFMIKVTENYLDDTDRSGYLSFTLLDGTTLTAPVKTFGRISIAPTWQAPDAGLNTG